MCAEAVKFVTEWKKVWNQIIVWIGTGEFQDPSTVSLLPAARILDFSVRQ